MRRVRPTAQASWAGVGKGREWKGGKDPRCDVPSELVEHECSTVRYQYSYESSRSKGPSRA